MSMRSGFAPTEEAAERAARTAWKAAGPGWKWALSHRPYERPARRYYWELIPAETEGAAA